VKALGFKVIQDAHAVLFHYESQSRGVEDKHPDDTARFKQRYSELLNHGDPYFNPLLQPDPIMTALLPRLTCQQTVQPRTVTVSFTSSSCPQTRV
jgi:hypothetical protein